MSNTTLNDYILIVVIAFIIGIMIINILVIFLLHIYKHLYSQQTPHSLTYTLIHK